MDYFYNKIKEVKKEKEYIGYKLEIEKLNNNKDYQKALLEKNISDIYLFEKELRRKEKIINDLFGLLSEQLNEIIKGDNNED